MACEAVRTWSLSGLLAAFLDLAVAYTLLCASAVAYLGSKFLGFFGLPLPCPCDALGFFSSIRTKSFCLNRLLMEFPGQLVSHVFLSVKEHFPFHKYSMAKGCNYSATVGEICVSGVVEMEGEEASCSSLSDARKADVVRNRELRARDDKYDLKGKGVVSHRPRSRMRQRRKWSGADLGKNSMAIGGESFAHSRDNMTAANGLVGGISLMGDHNDNVEHDEKASTTRGVMERAVDAVDEDIFMNSKALSIEELRNNSQDVLTLNEDMKNAIRLLEQKLEEERIARTALYIELEKERSASATAADEAMAMILRLQEEKATIEMEARQYQRILEEKSIYDAEEMTILKEILIRREKEKHFLEKEVEVYRQMASAGDKQIRQGDFEPNDDQVLIPYKCSDGVVSADKLSSKLPFANESSLFNEFNEQGDLDRQLFRMSECSSSGNMNLQEKQIISFDNNLRSSLKATQDCEKGTCFDKPAEKVFVSCHGTEAGDHASDPKGTLLGSSSNSCDSTSDKDSQVHDVHIDGINFCSEANAVDESKQLLLVDDSSEVHERNLAPSTRRIHTTDFPSSSDFYWKKSRPEMIMHEFQLIDPKGSSSLQQSCATPVDHEIVKIKSEVGWLQERLKLVQEGREKLSLSGENLQLKFLEDIACQVQEIRHLTETGKAARQVSLPLPISKAASKKRRSRSVSSGFQMSSEG